MWQRRAPAGKNPPLVTLIDESKTTSGKKPVVDDIMLAAARAPAKKVAPSASAPDLAPAPVFLDNPQATAGVKAVGVYMQAMIIRSVS